MTIYFEVPNVCVCGCTYAYMIIFLYIILLQVEGSLKILCLKFHVEILVLKCQDFNLWEQFSFQFPCLCVDLSFKYARGQRYGTENRSEQLNKQTKSQNN